MEQQANPPHPPPKSRMKVRKSQNVLLPPPPRPPPPPKSRMKLLKSQHVLFSYPWFGAGEEDRYKFPSLFCPRYSIGNSGRRMDFALRGGVVFSLWLNQVKGFYVLKTNWSWHHAGCGLYMGEGGRVEESPHLPSLEPQLRSRLPPSFITFFSDLAKYWVLLFIESISLCFWLAKMSCIIHHNQLLSTNFSRILRYLKNDVNIIVEKVQQN